MIYYDKDKKPLTKLSFNVDAPVGSMSWYCFKKIPQGWKLCDGSEISIAQYTDLYTVIGNTFGTPSKDGYFLLPDMNKRYIDCADLDEDGKLKIGYKPASAPDFNAGFAYPDVWQSGNSYSGAFYTDASWAWSGYNSGSNNSFSKRSISVDFSNDVNHGSIYAENEVKIPHRNVFIIIKAENVLDDAKLLAKVEVI